MVSERTDGLGVLLNKRFYGITREIEPLIPVFEGGEKSSILKGRTVGDNHRHAIFYKNAIAIQTYLRIEHIRLPHYHCGRWEGASVRQSKIKVVVRTQLTLQMLTLL